MVISRHRTAAVITAYRPTADLAMVVAAAREQCQFTVVVDNSPHDHTGASGILEPSADVMIVRPGHNSGLVGALEEARRHLPLPCDLILILDQDSTPPRDLVPRLIATLDSDPTIAVASPAPWDATENRFIDPRTARRPEVADLPVVITSGMLLRRDAFDAICPLDADFFLDSVDQEICLRLRGQGWRVVQDRRVAMPHQLGETRWHKIGPLTLRATHHPTWRLYFAARNTAILWRRFWRTETAWTFTSIAIQCYTLATIILFEPPRGRRAATFLHGVGDALRGRLDVRYLPPDARNTANGAASSTAKRRRRAGTRPPRTRL